MIGSMLVICINSYNSVRYMHACLQLLCDVLASGVDCTVMVVFGGCSACKAVWASSRVVLVSITANLSDHNIYVGYEQLVAAGVSWPTARFVLLHDTCCLGADFARCMGRIAALPQMGHFVFAHTYGLYNMGVATSDFMLQRAKDWRGVRKLPKDLGIRLEQGADITVEGSRVRSLHSYAVHTLACMGSSPWQLDTFSVQPCDLHGQKRFVSYVSAFGVYKPYASVSSFAVPVFAAHTPCTAEERAQILRVVSPRLCSSWAPLLPLPVPTAVGKSQLAV